MDDLRRRLADLDRIAVPDHWPEIERRAWSSAGELPTEPSRTAAAPAAVTGPTVTTRTRWIGPGRQPGRRSPVLTPVRVLAVAMVGTLSVGLLAVTLPSSNSSPGGVAGAPGATAAPPAGAASSPGPDGSAVPLPAAGGPIDWDTGCVQFRADWLRIQPDAATDEPDHIFTADGVAVSLNSDPGSDTYRTLEATWYEGASEMRVNLYFEADADRWWVRELRTYDGQPVPDWITYPGPLFATPLGETYAGDVELHSSLGNVPGTLQIRGLTLAVPDFGRGSSRPTCLSTSPVSNVEFGTVTEASPAADDVDGGNASDPAPLTPAVIAALDRVAADLLEGCYGRAEGAARLSAVLVEAGASGFFVRTDGPIGGPDDQMEEIMAHVDAGCVIYGGSGGTEDGTPVFYIGGGTGVPTSTFVPAAQG